MSTPLCVSFSSQNECSSVKPLKVNSPEEWRAGSVRTYAYVRLHGFEIHQVLQFATLLSVV